MFSGRRVAWPGAGSSGRSVQWAGISSAGAEGRSAPGRGKPEGVRCAGRVRDGTGRRQPRHRPADESGFRRARSALGFKHAGVSVRRAAWPTRPRHDQGSRGYHRRRPVRQNLHLRRRAEYPDRNLSIQGRRHRVEHSEHLVSARYRRRRPRGQAHQAVRAAWLRAGHARHALVVHARARRLAAPHARLQQHDHRPRH